MVSIEKYIQDLRTRSIISVLTGLIYAAIHRLLSFISHHRTFCDCYPPNTTGLDYTPYLISKPMCAWCSHTGIYQLAKDYFQHLILPVIFVFVALTLISKMRK